MSGTPPRYAPPDASRSPRFTGPRTFARLPQVAIPSDGVDAAIVGIPFDTATSFRTGARFGPEAIRSASALLRPYHPSLDVQVFGALSVVDGGDAVITPGNAQRSAEQIASGLGAVAQAGIVPVVLGGDHSIVLGELRAHAAVHGPVGLVLLDAHADTWDQYYGERYFHGTPFRRAVEEGVLDPSRSLLAGMRGSLYSRADLEAPLELGFEVISGEELPTLAPERYAERVRARVGSGPVFMSVDIDVLDPAFAPERCSATCTRAPSVCPRASCCAISGTSWDRSCRRGAARDSRNHGAGPRGAAHGYPAPAHRSDARRRNGAAGLRAGEPSPHFSSTRAMASCASRFVMTASASTRRRFVPVTG